MEGGFDRQECQVVVMALQIRSFKRFAIVVCFSASVCVKV